MAPSPLSGKRTRRRRDESAHHHAPPPRSATPGLAAGGGGGLFWHGGDREKTATTAGATATTVLDSSQGSSSTGTAETTARGRAVRWSPSSSGAYSPVDLRSAGRGGEGGALGLSSPPFGVVLGCDEEGQGESPPHPRAFWREEWLGGSGGGAGGGAGCSTPGCPRRGHPARAASDDSSNAAYEREPESRVGMTRRGCCCCYRSGSSSRDECCSRGGGSSSGGKGLRPHRCCSNKSLFRDARVKKACCCGGNSGDAHAQADWSSSATRCRGLSGTEAEQSRHEGEGGREQRVGTFGNSGGDNSNVSCGESKNSGSGEGVSVVGFVVLAAMAVAAFAAGTLVGPPRRQQQQAPPPPPPSASPPEYAPLLPSHQVYEPTLQESLRAKRRGPGRTAAVSNVKQAPPAAAGSEGGSRTHAAAEAGGREPAGVNEIEAAATTAAARADHSTSTGASGSEGEVMPEDVPSAVVNGCEQNCGEPEVSDRLVGAPGSETAPSTCCCAPRAAAAAVVGEKPGQRQHHPSVSVGVESGSGSAPGTAVGVSSHGGVIDGAASGGHEADSTEANPPSRSSSPSSSSGAGAAATTGASSEGRRLRRRRVGGTEATTEGTRPAVGATPAAFAQTLGRAERSLAGLSSSGSDENAERATARRAAMSRSAARSACKSLAWGKAALVAGAGPQDDDGACDTDSARKDLKGGLGVDDAPSATRKDDRPGGRYGQAAERTTMFSVEAAAAAAAGTLPGSSSRGLDAADGALLMSAKESGHDAMCSLVAGYVGLGSSLVTSSSATTTAEAKTLRRQAAAGGASASFHSRADSGHGRSSPPSGPRCRGLVLSGKDIQPSWAGRYVPVRAVNGGGDARQVPKAEAPFTQRLQAQTPYYYCLVPSLASGSSAFAVSEGGDRVPGEEAGKQGEDPPPPPLPLRDFLGKDERPREGAVADRSEILPAAAGRGSPTRPTVTEGKGSPMTAATSGTATVATAANPRPVLPPASTAGTAAEPGNDLGLPAVTDGGVMCLYWTDVGGGGRWVLDDDLRLSNGVLGVTKGGPAPAAADLAFPNQRHHPRPRPDVGEGVDSAAAASTSSREASGVEDILRNGGACGQGEGGCGHGGASAVEDGRHLEGASGVEEGVGGAVAGSETGGAGSRAPRVWREGQPTWLLDSLRLQDWVEAKNVFVVCETV